jgi:hypothetical protein
MAVKITMTREEREAFVMDVMLQYDTGSAVTKIVNEWQKEVDRLKGMINVLWDDGVTHDAK